jgi:predicted methyltransferase
MKLKLSPGLCLLLRREVEAAGFAFDSEIAVLTIPADRRTIEVFDRPF